MALIERSNAILVKHHHHEIASYRITEEQWTKGEIYLNIDEIIPDMLKMKEDNTHFATCVITTNQDVKFLVPVHNSIEVEKVKVEAMCSVKSSDGEKVGKFNCEDVVVFERDATFNIVEVGKSVKINPENLYDEARSFIFEIQLGIEVNMSPEEVKADLTDLYSLGKDMKSFFQDDENTDYVIRVDGKEFKCHKSILSARSNYFQTMFVGDHIETQTNSIDVRGDVPAKTIEVVLEYIYKGKIPNGENVDNFLLDVAEMYLLEDLKEACVKSLLDNLDVSTCLETFVLVDKFVPAASPVRGEVIKFMTCKAAEIIELDNCLELIKNYPVLTKELMKALGKEVKEKHCCQHCLIACSKD